MSTIYDGSARLAQGDRTVAFDRCIIELDEDSRGNLIWRGRCTHLHVDEPYAGYGFLSLENDTSGDVVVVPPVQGSGLSEFYGLGPPPS